MPELGESLSKRELEILECVTRGSGNKQIAAELFISQNTVKVHLRNVYAKLGVSSRTEATAEAFRLGLVQVPGSELEAEVEEAVEEEETAVSTDLPSPDPPAIVTVDEQTAVSVPEVEPSLEVEEAESKWSLRVWALVGLVVALALIVIALIGINYFSDTPPVILEEEQLSDNWIKSQPVPVTVAKAAIASFGLDLYLIGGEQDGAVSNDVYIYDTSTLLWADGAEKPTAVSETTAVELGGVIFVPGGRTADGQPTNIVELYSTANDAWGTAASLPEAIAGGLTLTDGSLIYFIGGTNDPDALNTLYVYDPSADSWRPLANMNHARAFASGGVIGNQLYVVGGLAGQTELDMCEVYDIVADSWDSCAPMLTARGGAGTAVLLNKLYIIGGGVQNDNDISFSEVYDPSVDAWSLVNTPMLAEEDSIWTHLATSSVENRIYTLGGYRNNNQQATNDNFAYAPLIYQTFIPAASAAGEE